jgi:hypothetical protein
MGRINCTKWTLYGRRVERERPENALEITNKKLYKEGAYRETVFSAPLLI